MINALSGTRMGRKVQSVEQALEDAKAWARNDGASKIESSLETGTPVSGDDIFRFSSLGAGPQGITLRGLEVPEGTWEYLYLVHEEFGHGRNVSQTDWVNYSEGLAEFIDETTLDVCVPTKRDCRIATTKAIYWFLRALSESRDDPRYSEAVKSVRDAPYYPEGFLKSIVTADQLVLEQKKNGRQQILSFSLGWPISHPINSYHTFGTLPTTNFSKPSATYIQKLYSRLFGDPNPSRIEEVFAWITKSKHPLEHNLSWLSEADASVFLNLKENALFLIPKTESCQAFGLYAHPEWFTPREVGK